EPFGGHLDGGVTDRRCAATDGRLRAGTFAGFDRVPEQQVERRLRRALGLCQLPCRAHLAEDLALAEHRRIESGCYLEQMGDRSIVVLTVELGVQLVTVGAGTLCTE